MRSNNHLARSDVRVSTNAVVTRVEYGVETPNPQQANPQPIVPFANDGQVRSLGSNGETTVRGFTSVTGAEIKADAHGGSGILATANDPTLKPSTLVTLPGGIGVNIDMAEKLGYVHRDATGRYLEGRPGQPQPQPQAPVQPQAPQQQQQPAEAGDVNAMRQELFTPEVEATLAHLVKGVAPEVINDGLIEAALTLAKSGSLDGFRFDDFAAMSGMQPQQAGQFMEAAISLFSTQADGARAREGAVRLCETINGDWPVNLGDSVALFACDRGPMTDEEIARDLQWMAFSWRDFLDLRREVPRGAWGFQPPGALRSPRRIVVHTALVMVWYVMKLRAPADPSFHSPRGMSMWRDVRAVERGDLSEARLTSLREACTYRLGHLRPAERAGRVTHHRPGGWTGRTEPEDWTARKIFRRFLWHERLHMRTMEKLAGAYRATHSARETKSLLSASP